MLRLVRSPKRQQTGHRGVRQFFRRGRDLSDLNITPVGDAQIRKNELAAVIDATGGEGGDAQPGVDELWRGLQRRIDPHLDDATAHGEAQQRAIFIQRRQRAPEALDDDALIMKAPRGEVVKVGRNARWR